MSVPDEFSEYCEGCSGYNVNYCTCLVISGKYYCEECLERKGFGKRFRKLVKNVEETK